MIELMKFRNFKVLRDTQLPLSRFTLIVGPNGSGKSTAMQALRFVAQPGPFQFTQVATLGLLPTTTETVEVVLRWGVPHEGVVTTTHWGSGGWSRSHAKCSGANLSEREEQSLNMKLARSRIYSLHTNAITIPVELSPNPELQEDGRYFAGVLDQLRDREPERFEAFNEELGRWLPEFDRILFDTPSSGHRAFLLRTRKGRHALPATDLSQGTLLALTILTLAYLPDPPPIVCLEEPDRGIHPRLLRHVQDALYRLSYPESVGEVRQPVQVLAITHSPYFLDLFKDHPEEIVIAHKVGQEARFERLSDQPAIAEMLGEAPLGEIWYSGILGGVPVES
jgi:predicted ATPase